MAEPLPLSPDHLQALGLSRADAAVVHAVLALEEATSNDIGAISGLAPSQVSRTVSALRRKGLLDRIDGRRPAVVFVSPHAATAAERLQHEADAARRADALRGEAAAEALRVAAKRTGERGRPMYEVVPATDFTSPSYDVLRLGRTKHDEVVRGTADTLPHWRPSPWCATRLLVAEPGPASLVPLFARLRRQQRRQAVQVRVSQEPHPDLLLLDDDRVRVTGGNARGRVHAWSREPLHVQAARQLFTLWWDAAGEQLDLPATAFPQIDETDLDVDEWDPTALECRDAGRLPMTSGPNDI